MTDSSDTLPDEGLDPNTGSMFSDNAPATNGAYQVLARNRQAFAVMVTASQCFLQERVINDV